MHNKTINLYNLHKNKLGKNINKNIHFIPNNFQRYTKNKSISREYYIGAVNKTKTSFDSNSYIFDNKTPNYRRLILDKKKNNIMGINKNIVYITDSKRYLNPKYTNIRYNNNQKVDNLSKIKSIIGKKLNNSIRINIKKENIDKILENIRKNKLKIQNYNQNKYLLYNY